VRQALVKSRIHRQVEADYVLAVCGHQGIPEIATVRTGSAAAREQMDSQDYTETRALVLDGGRDGCAGHGYPAGSLTKRRGLIALPGAY